MRRLVPFALLVLIPTGLAARPAASRPAPRPCEREVPPAPLAGADGSQEPDEPEPEPPTEREQLRAELEALVDLRTPQQRRREALDLAKRHRALEPLLEEMRTFGRFEPLEPGIHPENVPLFVDGEAEETQLYLYVPAAYDPATPAPLMLVFHGTGGSGAGLHNLWRGVAEELGMLVLAPSEAGRNEGYGWTERERQAALAALRWTRRRCNVDENRVFASGISRGGHLAWDLALRHPDLLAALAPMIGSPRIQVTRGQNNLRYLENVAQLPIRDLQGADDDPGMVFNLKTVFARLERLRAPDAELLLQEGHGHSFDMSAVDWVAFLGAARRDPAPDRVVRLVAHERRKRTFRVEVTKLGRSVTEDFRLKLSRGEAAKFGTLSDEQKRLFLQDEADSRTARIELKRTRAGYFEADAKGVEAFRVLLGEDDIDEDGKVEVAFEGKVKSYRVKPSSKVLLLEFAERFDRTFLPAGEVEVK